MKEATTTGVTADAVHARKLVAQAQKLREEKQAEKDAKAKRGQLSFKEKEKRKRNAGMQASCAPPPALRACDRSCVCTERRCCVRPIPDAFSMARAP